MEVSEPRVVCFDMGDIFFSWIEWPERILRVVRSFGMPPERECWFTGVMGRGLINMAETGRITPRQFWKYICRYAGISHKKLPEQLFSALYLQHLQPIESTIAIALQVQERYFLVGVSDGDIGSRYALQLLAMEPFSVRFAETSASFECKVKKPMHYMRAAEMLAKKYGCCMDEIVCVDDIDEYMAFMRECGARGVTFNGAKEHAEVLRWRLKEVGVVFP